MNIRKLLTAAILLLSCGLITAQCDEGFVDATVDIVTDPYPYEIDWILYDDEGTVFMSGGDYTLDYTAYSSSACVPEGACLTFSITDSYGDGIYAPGGYWVTIDGVQVATGYNYGSGSTQHFNCPEGSFCSTASTIEEMASYTAAFDNSWFTFTPEETGTYEFSTCGVSECDTRIYVYSTCSQDIITEGPEGSYAYNDDADCGTQAVLNVVLLAGTTYYIRIGDTDNSCSDSIVFNVSFLGPPQGCMDQLACNFNPIAAIEDGSCIYPGDPNCTGPDLQIDSTAFVQSLWMFTHQAQACDIVEGCVLGYGQRYVLAFSSKINNIGDIDYYIGNPFDNPQMFNTQNCHGHTHYNAYGDYRLFDMFGNVIPAGHKNGFCVMDLCGFGQYTCGDMGISAGCYDVYGAGTGCQWIDITEVPDGDYQMVVMVNPYHLADALNRNETNYLNNATQICIHIEHDVDGVPTYEIFEEGCSPYVDCEGVPGGGALPDCNGICSGPALFGDLYTDEQIDNEDITSYMNLLAQEEIVATSCNDLSGDGQVTIYDAALTVWCDHQPHLHNIDGEVLDQCAFPRSIENPDQTVGLAIVNADLEEGYVDIEMTNTNADVLAYQFRITGIDISSVVSLIDAIQYPAFTGHNDFTNDVFVISPNDSVIDRQLAPHLVCRVYFSAITANEICIDPIVDIVNKHGELTQKYIYEECVAISAISETSVHQGLHMVIQPNPVSNGAFIQVVGPHAALKQLLVHDQTGRLVQTISVERINRYFEVDFSALPAGVYTISGIDHTGIVCAERFVKL